jgi:hypothetical protein
VRPLLSRRRVGCHSNTSLRMRTVLRLGRPDTPDLGGRSWGAVNDEE